MVHSFVLALALAAIGCASRPETQPGVRNAHAMIFDETAGQVVMFGGADETRVRGDTWGWDAVRRRWRLLVSEGPSPRTFASFAYDAAHGEGVLFGGNRVLFGTGTERDTLLGDTWIWRDSRWSRRDIAGPRARSEAAMAYDRQRHRVVLFGGYYHDGGQTVRLGDTWEWDGARWREAASGGPEPRSGASMAYDERRGRVVLFGGSGRPPGTWEWDGQTWAKISGADAPSVFNPVMAFDTRDGVLLRFGGWTGSVRTDETWLLLASGWRPLHTPGPAARNHAALVFDRRSACAFLFGGHDGERVFGDVWKWEDGVWTRVLDVTPRRRVDNGH
jgi:hypothetical protein